MATFLLGIDVGTTSSKAVLVTPEGAVAAQAGAEHALSTPHPSWVEQAPEDWYAATVESIREVLEKSEAAPEDIAAIGLTGQMHGLVLLDGRAEVLRPCILWNDQRSAEECEALTAEIGAEHVMEHTGNPLLPGFTAPKIAWVQRHEPEVYERIAHVLLPKDYVRYRLTGAFVSDVADASGTSLFEVRRRRWSDEMLAAFDVPREWLPEVTESPEVSAHLSAEAARATGLREGTPVVSGAGDQAAGAVGSGITREGLVSVTVGTSGVVFAASGSYRADPEGRLHAFCHAVPGQWHLMGVMLSAAGSLRWYRDRLAPEVSYDDLLAPAAEVAPGSEGLVFLPYLTGERTPHADPDARGAFVGLTLRHERMHLTRAVLEGVAFGLRDSLELIKGLGLGASEVRVSGGGARSDLWRQIIADVLRAELLFTKVPEGAACGAALLAGTGVGVFSSVEEASTKGFTIGEHTPPSQEAPRYDELYERYRALYPALAPHFRALSHAANSE